MAHKKSFLKRASRWVFGLGIIQWPIAIIIALCIWILFLTCPVKFKNLKTFMKYRRRPAVFAFWHGRSMMLSPIVALRGMRSYAIASRHNDGRIMAKLQLLFGLRPIYGSTSDGGMSVLRAGVMALRRGDHSMCISPDGPGGPALCVQPGALYFAKMTGAPIIPVCYSASRAHLQNRWDRYLIPMPFSRIICYVGEPIFVPNKTTDVEFEIIRKNIEDVMVKQLREMDGEFNLPYIEQGVTASEYKHRMRAIKQGQIDNKVGKK